MALNFAIQWIHGAADCLRSTDPPLQTHEADGTTVIFRQSKCSSFEAPFMYLLIGTRRSLLVDTGAPTDGAPLPMRATVDAILAGHDGPTHELVIAHSHGHGDHAAWDRQFVGRPRTTIVPMRRPDIQSRFAIDRWPEGRGTLDLGGRVLTVLPIPGHEEHHIAIHDSRTKLLLTGDTLYPGLLVVNDWRAYRLSAKRLKAFASGVEISAILGAHVEMARTGELFPIGSTFQPDEHPLPLSAEDLTRWTDACERLGENPPRREHVFRNFVIDVRG